MGRMKIVFLCSALALVSAVADDWPRFLGEGGRSRADEAPGKMSFSEADYVWEAKLEGKGHSSPVVFGGKVYLTVLDEGALVLAAFGLEDGKRLWEKRWEVTGYPHHKFNGMASSTVCADAERVYLSWTTGRVRRAAALDHLGQMVWDIEVGAYSEEHGSAASPVVSGGVLVVPNDCVGEGAILGFDLETGVEKWRVARAAEKTSFSTPLELDADTVVVGGTPYGLTAIHSVSGRIEWESEAVFGERTVASPVFLGAHVFASAGSGSAGKQSVAFPVVPGGEAFSVKKGLPYVPTGVSDGGRLYLWGDGGVVHCVEVGGGETLWRERASGPCYASPLLLGDVLVGCSKKGEVVMLRAGGAFEVLGRSEVGEPLYATPAFVGGRLLLRTATRLIAVAL